MKRYVVDASCVGPLVIPDEAENLMPIVVDALAEGKCIVPGHWRYEVGNLGLMAMRRKRADLETVRGNLRDLADFDVEVDRLSTKLAWTSTLLLADRHGLTLYDAAYLELAVRESCVLLSADRRLISAAAAENVTTNAP